MNILLFKFLSYCVQAERRQIAHQRVGGPVFRGRDLPALGGQNYVSEFDAASVPYVIVHWADDLAQDWYSLIVQVSTSAQLPGIWDVRVASRVCVCVCVWEVV